MKLETKGEATKQHLINVGSQLFYEQGYKNTGLSQILKEACVTKGSFYFHFDDKETFGLSIIDYYTQVFKDLSKSHLNNDALSPAKKIEAFHYFYLDLVKQNGYRCGCPIGNFSQELAALNPAFASKISTAFSGMVFTLSKVISEGVLLGEFKASNDIEALASFIVDSWEGALLRMKSVKNAEPLENWFVFTQQLLLVNK
jgi:TetR/AcrR family transcriptional repressor of nem operon